MEHTSHRSVTATLDGAPYTTHITTRGIDLTADEPTDHGGLDTGMRPHELLLASLSACTAITLRMYADRKGWDVNPITVKAELARTQNGKAIESRIHLEIGLPPGLANDQSERLLQIARSCPVHRTLESPITLSSALAP